MSLAKNNCWSNHRLYTACSHLSEQEYFAHRPSYFGSIHATLNHILIVDLLYLDRIKGQKRVSADCEELYTSLPDLQQRQLEVDRELIDLAEAQDASSLALSVTFKVSSGDTYTETIARILLHLFVHQVHHRGQVHGLLSQTSSAAPQLDEFFLAGDLPLRAEELKTLALSQE